MKRKVFTAIALLLVCGMALMACAPAAQDGGADGKALRPVQIATKPMTEELILGEMLKMVIEEYTDHTANITKGIAGGTGNIQPAMEKGDFDLYPEYTSTGWQFVLKHEDEPYQDNLFGQLQKEYGEEYGFEWVGMYGFGDQFGLAVRKEIADANNLETYSDLAAVSPELVFCAEPDFYEREDGFDNLCETYGYTFKETRDMDIGLKYPAINSGKVDVMDIFTTDGQLAAADVKVLKDDKNYFASAQCGTVVRQDALENYAGLREALMKMEGIINEEEMTRMNYDVETNKRGEHEVAEEFLKSKGVIS